MKVLYFSKPDLVVCDTYALLDCMDKTLSLSLGTYLSKEETIGVYYIITLPNGDKGRILKSSVECIPTFIQSCRSKTYLWRHKLLEYGTMMIGAPYLWGGRSFYKELSYSNFRSCDCSGLISLLYRLIGVRIPRDAHDQYLSTSLCEIEELEMGDVFFLAKKTAMDLKVYHVLLYIGGEKLLEASSDFNHTVLEKSCLERFQVKKKQLRQGMWVKALDSQIFFGKLWDGHISKNLFC